MESPGRWLALVVFAWTAVCACQTSKTASLGCEAFTSSHELCGSASP